MKIEPWIEAEPLWDKMDPEVRLMIRASVAAHPEARKDEELWTEAKNSAWRAMFSERTRYRALPESFTIYRGQNRGVPVKNSWAFDRRVGLGRALLMGY